jgi:hypothetical protein
MPSIYLDHALGISMAGKAGGEHLRKCPQPAAAESTGIKDKTATNRSFICGTSVAESTKDEQPKGRGMCAEAHTSQPRLAHTAAHRRDYLCLAKKIDQGHILD